MDFYQNLNKTREKTHKIAVATAYILLECCKSSTNQQHNHNISAILTSKK